MPATYESIATTTLGSNAPSITFSSIPGTYTDLVLVVNGLGSVNTGIVLTFNGATSNFANINMGSNGSSASTSKRLPQSFMNLTYTSFFTTAYNGIIVANIMNYASTAMNKSVVARAGNFSNGTEMMIGTWFSNSAITSLTVGNDGSGNIGAGTTFSLYGIKAA